jgi:osmotically-inducible protein OsmY
VEVNDGVVTLTGSESIYAQKIAAPEAAHRVAGVLDVANEIEVAPLDFTQRRNCLRHWLRS